MYHTPLSPAAVPLTSHNMMPMQMTPSTTSAMISHNGIPSRAPSPSGYSRSSDGLPFLRTSPSMPDFQIEKSTKSSRRRSLAMPMPAVDDEFAYRESVSRLLQARSRVSTISGLIPMDPSQLVLFFRTKSGITHSLDFPIDVDYNTPPALDVLIAACRPHQTSDLDDYSDQESLFYPPNLPLTTSLEIGNHPIMDAVRSTLFPLLPHGHYLTVMRDKLEVLVSGGGMGPQSRMLRNDGRVATLIVTLPVRFRGGSLLVRDAEGHEERFFGRGGKNGDMEWVAFSSDCEYEVDVVQKGCKISILYGVYLKTFGPSGLTEPLINPSDIFLDLLSPVLNMSRGRKIGFYLTGEYGVRPEDVLAESVVPMLKGGDSILYHALKLYKLIPELHWTAGGYIWPVDRTVEIADQKSASAAAAAATPMMSALSILDPPPSASTHSHRHHRRDANSARRTVRGGYQTQAQSQAQVQMPSGYPLPSPSSYAGSDNGYFAPEVEDLIDIRHRVAESGAVPLSEADITVLSDWNVPANGGAGVGGIAVGATGVGAFGVGGVGKERVPFVDGRTGEIERLVVNMLMVVYVP